MRSAPFGLLEPIQEDEHAAKIGIRIRVVGTPLHAAAGGVQSFLEAACVRQRAHQVEVCVPGPWIVREDVAEEVVDQECGGQRDDDGFRKQAGCKQPQRQRVASRPGAPSRTASRSAPLSGRTAREQVLALDDPGDRLDMQGVHGEDGGDD